MKTLTEKDLKYYLGTGLKFLTCYNIENNPVIEEMTMEYLQLYLDIPINEKPLMLPLSALTEPLEDGSVPIVEMAKIVWSKDQKFPNEEVLVQSFNEKKVFMCHYMKQEVFGYDSTTSSFFSAHMGINNSPPHQLALFEYLYQHHFWLGDQSYFEQGLIIDKRTVKTE